MKRIILKTAALFFLTIPSLFFSCSKEPSEILPDDPVIIDLTADQVSLIRAENSFAFDIFKKVIETASETDNIIISPLSLSCALAMTLNGSSGTSRDAMMEALRVNGLTPELINHSYKNLSGALLNVDKRVQISIANSVWTENNFVVKKPFINILADFYSAESRSFEISDPLAPKQINSWIESKTNGLIKNMVEKLNDNTVMLLINAIYFKGKWKSPFKTDNTVQNLFYKADGTTSEVPMMKQTSEFNIFDGDGFILAEFPYGQGNFVMDVILPDRNTGINGIMQILSENSFKDWLNNMVERETELSFPRFKYGFKNQFKEIMTGMGMGICFTDNADFSNISDLNLLINEVTHQAFIETNEEGTEAAAATVVDIGVTSLPPPPLILTVDHPFLYLVREKTTSTILFMGKVTDPLDN